MNLFNVYYERAAQMFGVEPSKVTPNQYRAAKRAMLAELYSYRLPVVESSQLVLLDNPFRRKWNPIQFAIRYEVFK